MVINKKWCLAKNISLDLSAPLLMGILNVTPDSFSDGGEYCDVDKAYKHCCNMLKEGAHILDIGGESTRPNSTAIASFVEQQRILPIIKKLNVNKDIIISVDTYNSDTANLALQNGAHIINDIYGLQYDLAMADVVAQYKAGIIIMHTNRNRHSLPDIIDDQKYFFEKSLNIAHKAGIKDEAIALDPGFGFGKNAEHNIKLFKRINDLNCFNYPLVAATSRKRFLGTICGIENSSERDIATAATSILLRQNKFAIFRVHNIAYNKQALDICETLR